MSNIQSLRGEQARSQTRKRIAIAVAKTLSSDPKTIAEASGLSIATIRKNAEHVSAIFAQESKKPNQPTTMSKIKINTSTPEHTGDGYWGYTVTVEVDGTDHEIECWKLATWLARGASEDIDGSGLECWGNSQPGGWRVLDSDSQSRGKPDADHSETEGFVTVGNSTDSIEIPVPAGEGADEFIVALQEAIDNAASEADPDEPEADEVWEELGRAAEMDDFPVRIGKAFGSSETFAVYETDDGFTLETADEDEPGEELEAVGLTKFREEFRDAVQRAKGD